MAFEVNPLDSLYNRDVSIAVNNLNPSEIYEIKLHYRHTVGTYGSAAVFKSSGLGRIDLDSIAPIRGTYSGIRPMGLFESLEPLEDIRAGSYLRYYGDELKKLEYELFLYDSRGSLVSSKKFVKRLMAENIERIEIEDPSGLRGVLFKPKGEGPFPTIMDILGTGGGLSEQRGAAFACEGFCCLVIAYFQYKDLTQSLHQVEQSYFINAVNWLTSQPFTSEKIGLHGSSFGGILCLMIARLCQEKIKAIVSINPPHVMNNFAHISKDKVPLPHTEVDSAYFEFRGDILLYDKAVKQLGVNEETDIRVEEIPKEVDVRFVVSMDDVSTSSHYSCQYLTNRLRKSGHYVEYDCQPGGHIMEPPFYPHTSFCFSRLAGGFMAYGGEASIHGISEVKLWNGTLKFFKDRLTTLQLCTKTTTSKL